MNTTWKKIFPLIYGVWIYTCLRLVNDVISDTKFWLRPWHVTVIELVCVIITSYIIIYVIDQFAIKQRAKIIKKESKPLREFVQISLVIQLIITFTAIPLAAFTDNGLQWYDAVNIYLIPWMFSLLYYAISRGNFMIQYNYEQQLKLEKISNRQLQAELRFLRAQYHPHFLFNALNTVYFQMDENVDKAKYTIEQLSQLLRYQLYDQQNKVPIERELQHILSYIELQKQRMNEHLVLEVAFDQDLKQQEIYPLLLLPLVENAFKYVGGEYWIKIAARFQDGKLLFEVSNAVPGSIPINLKGGIGLENLKRSLSIQYPGAHSFNIIAKEDYFTASLIIDL